MKNGKHRTSNIEHRTLNDAITPWTICEGPAGRRRYDLEDRLLEFASTIIDLSESLPDTRSGNHVAVQILRSGTSPYSNHGEAESAESREDFVHKLKLCLKELRETRRWARLIERKHWVPTDRSLAFILTESDELIRIFMASVRTARRNLANRQSEPEVCSQEAATTRRS